MAFLKIINNPQDEVAWHRVLNLQMGIGDTIAAKIFTQVSGLAFGEILKQNLTSVLPGKSALGWQNLLNIFRKLKVEETVEIRPEEVILTLTKSDYRNYLEAEFPNWQERLEDINQLAAFAERYENLNEFLAEISLQELFVVERGKPSVNAEEKIILSTIHQAKGLEWQAVFVINLVDTAFPNQRALNEANGLEEERRLFYVAITRAQKQLFLTYPLTGNTSGMYLNTPSRFLEEVAAELLDEVKLLSGLSAHSDLNDGDVQYLPDLDSL